MNEMVWDIKPRKFDDVITQILFNRRFIKSYSEKEKIDDFLNPDFKKLYNPYLINGIKEAVERIVKAKNAGEKIGIFADYDADGIPGAALLARVLQKIGIKFCVYIPTRQNGYGLSRDGIDFLISKKCSLIITVDLGIRNIKEAEYCKGKIDLIITDHHTLGPELPKADVVINPKIGGYPFKDLCGCGVVFKLIFALSKEFKEIDESFLKWNLDLVAISTISDVVPLTGENRILANFGLIVLKKTKNLGLKSLYEKAKIDKNCIGSYTVAFQIGPRINAPGRMDHATKSYELLISEDKREIDKLSMVLNQNNIDRQEAMDKIETEVTTKIIKNNLAENNIIIINGKWSKGIVGPVASRIVEKFNRPTILFSDEKDSYCGSARSLSEIDILKLLKSQERLIKKYGGHKGAAGITVPKSNFAEFKDRLIETANKTINKKALAKKIIIEMNLAEKDMKLDLYKSIKKLEPFGMGNSKPLFIIEKAEVINQKIVGNDQKHLFLRIKVGKKELKAIYFNYSKEKLIKNHNIYDIVFSVDLDEWNDQQNLSLNIVDLKKA
jgi:single-stranded-DNA-specific exonuclease